MSTIINATTTTGVVIQPDNSGSLVLQSSGTTVATVSSSGFSVNGAVLSPYLFKNKIINGNFDIWQRGTSVSTTSSFGYAADRWRCGGTMTASRQTFTVGQTEVPNNPKYYMQVNVTADSMNYEFQQRIEGVQTLAGKTVTVSYYARRTSGTVTTGLNLVQDFGSGGSPSSVVVTSFTAPSYTTSWQKFTATATLPSISGKTIGTNGDDNLYLSFQFSNTATGVIEIAQVQVEEGSYATSFEIRPLQIELALCQRYYWRIYSKANYTGYGNGWNVNTSSGAMLVKYPVTMRAKATSIDYSLLSSTVLGASEALVATATLDGTNYAGTDTSIINISSSGLFTSGFATLTAKNSTSSYLGFSAEFA